MTISIAEYLGQRTDVDLPDILPSQLGGELVPTCPFSGVACRKLGSNPPYHPVCSVRVFDREHNSKPFIVCPDRLLPAKARTLSPSQIAALAGIAQVVLPGANTADIGYKRQIGINLGRTRLVLDYVLQVRPEIPFPAGPRRVSLEMQGGGETSNTGTITRHVRQWAASNNPTNAFLAQRLTTEYLRQQTGGLQVNVPNIIPNNAWKRQLDQALKKGGTYPSFWRRIRISDGRGFVRYMCNTRSQVAGRTPPIGKLP